MNNDKKPRILIACEYSGRVREEFAKIGFEAWSCDLLDTEIKGNHYKGDVFKMLEQDWDALIAFPPCTYLSSAGLHWCNPRHGQKAIDRVKKRDLAAEFFLKLYNQPIGYVCIENPLGYVSSKILKPTQIVHPYYFGECEMKRTALWLRNLPPLKYSLTTTLFSWQTSSPIPEPYQVQYNRKTGKKVNRYFTDCLVSNKLKMAKERSMTFISIAENMAKQWGDVIKNKT